MKILLVGGGASFSIKDVEQGYFEALVRAGVETHLYLLDKRISIAHAWCIFMWKRLHKSAEDTRPTWDDTIYRAGIEALEMALRYDVDWVVVVSAMYFHPDVIVMMRRAGLKICILFTESPYEDEKQKKVAELVQLCSTNERTSPAVLGPNCFYLPHAFSDPSCDGAIVHNYELTEYEGLPQHDVVFVGSGFPERVETLEAIDWGKLGIDLGLYGTWSLVPPRSKLRKFICGGVIPNREALGLYSRAKIGLNLHRTSVDYKKNSPRISYAESLNPRAFELASIGTFCLTDYRKEGEEIFGSSQPTFNGFDDLQEMVLHYLKNPEERALCSSEAQYKVRGHTFDKRVTTLLEHLGGY